MAFHLTIPAQDFTIKTRKAISMNSKETVNYELNDALKKYFNYDKFRPKQEEIVGKILAGKEVLAIMPTSAGKSLLYQLPSLMRPGYTLVISPLISLMVDQVASLTRRGLPAAFINSSLSDGQKAQVLRDVEEGKVKLLYAAPESLGGSEFGTFIDKNHPSMLAVDEAHCVSQYGHDFRPAYLKIGSFVRSIPGLQICAFTATATPRVREDIRRHLLRPDMEISMSSFRRPNLSFSTIEYSSRMDKERELVWILKDKCPTIIYTATRADAERLAKHLGALCYHGDMSDLERCKVQELFMDGHCDLLAATNAFGLGIDRPDIRRVIHWSTPGSLEAYYQEAGRAGRDEMPADCILFHSAQDFKLQEQMVESNNPGEHFLKSLFSAVVDIARTHGSDTLELTVAALAARIPWARNEGQVGIALNMLSKFGYIERKISRQNPGTLRFLKDLPLLLQWNDGVKKLSSRFICKCIEHFGNELLQGARCTYDQLAEISGLDVMQARRALQECNGDSLAWTSPFYGCITKILRPDETSLNSIDFVALEAKRQASLNRLNEMFNYARTTSCRQSFILEYFGETPSEICQRCDNCSFHSHISKK
jgi:ATP-dependent DNA helicase RecQ